MGFVFESIIKYDAVFKKKKSNLFLSEHFAIFIYRVFTSYPVWDMLLVG